MKKTLLLACAFISFATITQAQIKKGSVLLGGGIGIGKSTTDNDVYKTKSNSINLSPTVGLAVKDNWVMGLSTSFSSYESKPSPSSNNQEIKGYSAGLFVRRYHSLGKSFYLYGDGTISYNKYNSESSSGTDYFTNYTSKGVGIHISPGISYAVSKRFHLEAFLNNLLSLGYTTNEAETVSLGNRTTAEGKSFDFSTNFSATVPLTIGFRFVLGK